MIFTALFLTLDKYSSWRVGRVVPMIRSAVQATLRCLLRSDLGAELNQTVIVFLWLSGRALRQRLWVQFPENTHADTKNV